MTIIVSLVFLLASAATAYAFYATLAPAMPRINELMVGQPMLGTPRMIYFGIDRRSAYRMEQEKKLVAIKTRTSDPLFAREIEFRRAA